MHQMRHTVDQQRAAEKVNEPEGPGHRQSLATKRLVTKLELYRGERNRRGKRLLCPAPQRLGQKPGIACECGKLCGAALLRHLTNFVQKRSHCFSKSKQHRNAHTKGFANLWRWYDKRVHNSNGARVPDSVCVGQNIAHCN